MLDAIAGRGRFGELCVEHPESDDGKQLAGLARAFGNALRPALRQVIFIGAARREASRVER